MRIDKEPSEVKPVSIRLIHVQSSWSETKHPIAVIHMARLACLKRSRGDLPIS